MTKQEAIDALSDGHTIYQVAYAKEICETLGVKLPKKMIRKFYSDPPGTFKGLTMKVEGDEGVSSLALSEWVASSLGVADQAGSFHGRGSQARAYAMAVEKALS